MTILADEAATAAQQSLTMCIRAFEFLPPVDVTFGDYLRALVTADQDLYPEDRPDAGALIEAFRVRGIYPGGVDSLAEESLCWPTPTKPAQRRIPPRRRRWRQVIGEQMLGRLREDGGMRTTPSRGRSDGARDWTLRHYAMANAEELKLTPDLPDLGRRASIRPSGSRRTAGCGSRSTPSSSRRPTRPGDEPSYGGLPLHSGTTVVFGDDGAVRFLIAKPLSEEHGEKRGKRLRRGHDQGHRRRWTRGPAMLARRASCSAG